MAGRRHLANDAWEALLTAHAVLIKQFAAEDIWTDVSMREYDVLYALSKCREPQRLSELNRHVLLSQPACPAWLIGWPNATWSSANPTPPTDAACACRSPTPAGPCRMRSGAGTPAA